MSKLVEVKVPDIGDFKDIPIIEVMVKPGDAVNAEEPLITLESDKATMEVPAPRAGYVWAPGHWMAERLGYRWVPDHWNHVGNGWRHEAGYWDRQQAKSWGDRDHDGVPNAVDRHPDNSYRR